MSDLAGRRALLTGAAVRVGRTLALACAAEGMDGATHYTPAAAAPEATAEECRAHGVRAA